MIIAKNEEIFNNLFEKAKDLCGHLNNHGTILVKLMEKIGYHILLIVSRNFWKT